MNDPGQNGVNRRKIIMIVDDAAETRSFVTAILQAAGYAVLGASTAAECFSLLTRVLPRLILLDVQMPEEDGFGLCRRIRKVPSYRGIPIAFLTAHKAPEDVQAGISAGGDDFILKPVSPRVLIDRTAHWSSTRATAPDAPATAPANLGSAGAAADRPGARA